MASAMTERAVRNQHPAPGQSAAEADAGYLLPGFEQTGFDSNGKILGHFVPTGLQPSFLEKFEVSGIKLPEGFFTPAGANDIAFEGGRF